MSEPPAPVRTVPALRAHRRKRRRRDPDLASPATGPPADGRPGKCRQHDNSKQVCRRGLVFVRPIGDRFVAHRLGRDLVLFFVLRGLDRRGHGRGTRWWRRTRRRWHGHRHERRQEHGRRRRREEARRERSRSGRRGRGGSRRRRRYRRWCASRRRRARRSRRGCGGWSWCGLVGRGRRGVHVHRATRLNGRCPPAPSPAARPTCRPR